MKKYLKRITAYLLCVLMVFTCVFVMDAPKVKAGGESEKVTFSINGSGKVYYSIGNNNSWTEASEGKIPSDELPNSDQTIIYVKAEADQGNKIEEDNSRQLLRYDDADNQIPWADLASGAFSFTYDSNKKYSITIHFVSADASSSSDQVSFHIGGSGKVYYSLENNTSWTEVSEGKIPSDALPNSGSTTIYLKAEANQGNKLEPGTGAESRQWIRYDDVDHEISVDDLASGSFLFTYDSEKSYDITINFISDNGSSSGGSQVADGKYKVSMQVDSELTPFNPSVDIEFYQNETKLDETKHFSASSTTDLDIPEGSNQIKVIMSKDNLCNARIIPSEGVEIDLFDQIRGNDENGGGVAIANISGISSFELSFEFSNKRNVSWSYDSRYAGSDKYVEHARIELLSADQAGAYLDWGRTEFDLTIGEDYYFELIPDYGYQIVSLEINGYTVEPQTTVGVFKFKMSDSNFHFKGIVEPANNQVNNKANMLSGVSIERNSASEIKGNLKLSATDETTDIEALSVVDGEVLGTVDLGLEQIISKGNGSYWESGLSELSGNVELSLDVPANQLAPGQTYTIVREHGGTYEELDATYDATTGKLTFATDKFSKYTIVKVGSHANNIPESNHAPEENKKDEVSGEQTEEQVYTPQPIGDVVGGTSITSWNDLDKVLDTKKISTTKTNSTGTAAATGSPKTELVQLKLRNNNTTVPASTFANLSNTNYSGLHLFTGNGTAVTFVNDAKLAGQKAINVGCSTVSLNGRKIITFETFTKLSSTVVLHATVPAGTKTVSVYFTGADKKRTLITTVAPTAVGRLCFAINQLGKYELVYN